MSIRVGILQCDHVADELQTTHDDYDDMFTDMLLRQDSAIETAVYDLINDHFPHDLSACDGYIITGSQHSVYEDLQWIHKSKQLVEKLYTDNRPTIGICFGHQLIAEALGGKVERAADKGWGVGVQQWNLCSKQDWMSDTTTDNIALLASHQDQVMSTPDQAKLLISSDFCPIAGYQCDEHFLALQGHPEFTPEYSQALLEKRKDRIPADVSAAAIESLKNQIDSAQVARWMLNFIQKHSG